MKLLNGYWRNRNGNNELQAKILRLEQENKQMKSALEEINILAKNYCNACDEFKAKTYKNKNDCLCCNYGFIKTKIKEVLK